MKTLTAVFCGSMASAAISTLGLTVYNIAAYDGQSLDFLQAMASFFLLAAFDNLVACCTLGLLWDRIARSHRWVSTHAYWPPAVLVGITPPLLTMIVPLMQEGAAAPSLDGMWIDTFILLMSLGSALGGLMAVFAWLIRRPDRDAPNPPTPTS